MDLVWIFAIKIASSQNYWK